MDEEMLCQSPRRLGGPLGRSAQGHPYPDLKRLEDEAGERI